MRDFRFDFKHCGWCGRKFDTFGRHRQALCNRCGFCIGESFECRTRGFHRLFMSIVHELRDSSRARFLDGFYRMLFASYGHRSPHRLPP